MCVCVYYSLWIPLENSGHFTAMNCELDFRWPIVRSIITIPQPTFNSLGQKNAIKYCYRILHLWERL